MHGCTAARARRARCAISRAGGCACCCPAARRCPPRIRGWWTWRCDCRPGGGSGGSGSTGSTGSTDGGRGTDRREDGFEGSRDTVEAECRTDEAEVAAALALVLGVSEAELPGHRLIVDRAGWLRARARPGQAAWSESDLVCRSGPAEQAAARAASGPAKPDGLDALIRRMDDEPVRLVRGGFPH